MEKKSESQDASETSTEATEGEVIEERILAQKEPKEVEATETEKKVEEKIEEVNATETKKIHHEPKAHSNHHTNSDSSKAAGYHKGRSIVILVFLVLVAGFMAYDLNSGGCFGMEGGQRDLCFYEQARCDFIPTDSSYKELCLVDLAVANSDLEACSELTDSQTQGNCQMQIAIEEVDVEICYDIKEDYWIDNCLFAIGGLEEGKYYCAAIGSEEQSYECYLEYAIQTENPSLCFGVGLEDHDRCVISVAKESLDLEHCSFVKSSFYQDVCVLKLIPLKPELDVSICDTISWTGLNEDCLEKFVVVES